MNQPNPYKHQFSTWNFNAFPTLQMPSFKNQYPPYNPLSHLNRSQNNYYHHHPLQRPDPYPIHTLFASHQQPSSNRLSRPHPQSRIQKLFPLQSKPIQVIDLDENSQPQAIVITDSEEQVQVRSQVKKIATPQVVETFKRQPANSLQQIVVQNGTKSLGQRRKRKTTQSHYQQPDCPMPILKQRQPLPKGNKKSTNSQSVRSIKRNKYSHKFVYELKKSEKELMKLSECRQYFPSEIMTGPQFQVELPPFSLSLNNVKQNTDFKNWLAEKRNKLFERMLR